MLNKRNNDVLSRKTDIQEVINVKKINHKLALLYNHIIFMENKMLKKNIAAAVMALSLITGCSSLTGEQSANLDRDAEIGRIVSELEATGYDKKVKVLPAVDEVLDGVAKVAKSQVQVAKDYRKITKLHRDVASFLAVNKGKTELELLEAAKKFDLNAKNANEKITPKLKTYRKATEKISEANGKLTIDLALQAGYVGLLVSQYGTEIAQLGGLKILGGMFSGGDEDDAKPTIASALINTKDQLFLLDELNSIIEADQEVAENLNKLQEQMNARG